MTRFCTTTLLLVALAAVIMMLLAPLTARATADALSQVRITTESSISLAQFKATIEQPLQENGRTHAQNTHTEADDVYKSCRQNGPANVFLEPDGITVHLLCKMHDGSGIGDWVFKMKKGLNTLVEKTAFMPKDGTMATIKPWLDSKGAVEITLKELIKLLLGG